MNSDGMDVFEDFDRFAFPGDIHRVTAGFGGEVILIVGSEKTAIIDCGMAYCGEKMTQNLKERLAKSGRNTLDYVILTHSHYDHMGALPYVLKAFPEVKVCASSHCKKILDRPNAKALIKELGTAARDLYTPGNMEEIIVEPLRVDVSLEDGQMISLGNETLKAMVTKGHTDCSMSYALEPAGILFSSESTGLIEHEFQICTPILKSFEDAFVSLKRCREYDADYVCLPHFGLMPRYFNRQYWQMFEEECNEKLRIIKEMKGRGCSEDEMLQCFKERMWKPIMAKEQPIEAFLINTKNTIKAALKVV